MFDSTAGRWQSVWLRDRPQALKVELGSWDGPVPAQWVARLDRAIARRRQPVFLIAHSLGCLAVAWWGSQASADRLSKVRAALLVAPPDVDRPDAHRLVRPFAPAPRMVLPFRTVLVASRSDPYATFARSAELAASWGAELIDAGDLGHVDADSDLGGWPDGLALLDRLRSDSLGRRSGARLGRIVPDRGVRPPGRRL